MPKQLNQTKSITEEELIFKLKRFDEQAFSYLYDNYSGALFGIIKRNIPNDLQAGDMLQEVFIKIYKNIEQYNPERGKLFTWMVNLTRNLTIDYLRSKENKSAQKNQSIENTVNLETMEYQTETATNNIGLKKLIEKLPENQFDVFDLVYFKGYTQQEASDQLGIPIGTVKTRVKLGISTLKKAFQIIQ